MFHETYVSDMAEIYRDSSLWYHAVLSIICSVGFRFSVLEGMLRCICCFNLMLSEMKGSERNDR